MRQGPVTIYDHEAYDRRVIVERILGAHDHPCVRITLQSGPRGAWSTMTLRIEEMDQVVTAFLRHLAARAL